VTESINFWQLISYDHEHGIPSDVVESVGEVQLHYHMVVRYVHEKPACGANSGFTTTGGPNAKLNWCETVSQHCNGVFIYEFGR